jgi:siderophore synthetase component
MASASEYMSQRIIDACLRENVCELVSKAEVLTRLPPILTPHWPHSQPEAWLKVSHLTQGVMYIPVAASHYMQPWKALSYAWIGLDKANEGRGVYRKGYHTWLTQLAADLSTNATALFLAYIKEADCAVSHRLACQQAFNDRKIDLSQPLNTLKDWQRQLLFSDQLAAYLDHPYYPTARAKVGFDTESLSLYAPEFGAQFKLNWLAIPKASTTLTSNVLSCWPSMKDVGLDQALQASHSLFPVHPLTLKSLDDLPQGALMAPNSALTVQATLSVRTLALVDYPGVHIKVPLLMATLGAKNIRSIKPSTLYDGHWFEQALTRLAQCDPVLAERISHVDEQHGGHLGDNKLFAYIVRRYPSSMQAKHLVPVAALASPLPDGRLHLMQLADEYYQGNWQAWFSDYLSLMLKVHLRLWLKYGIALESNQQNAILAFSGKNGMSLVMKDNDSARLLASRYRQSQTQIEREAHPVESLIDQRIFVDDDEALAQMFTTITLQLDIAAIIEAMAAAGMATTAQLYGQLRACLLSELDSLQLEGVATDYARHYLLAQTKLPVKYLLCSGSLLSKAESGARDVNKFYGQSAPNFLLADYCEPRAQEGLARVAPEAKNRAEVLA